MGKESNELNFVRHFFIASFMSSLGLWKDLKIYFQPVPDYNESMK